MSSRENIAGIAAYRFVTNSVIIKFIGSKAEMLNCFFDGCYADGFIGFFTAEVYDGHLYFNSDVVCTRLLKRCDKTVVYQILSVHFSSPYRPEYAI